ncbi:MAG: response regulator transcription factor [Terriglobales bacterium]
MSTHSLPLTLDVFSPRERQIVSELLEAQSVKEIACKLNLSVNTVKDYLKTVYQKAQVHSARELLVKLYEERELRPAEPLPAAQLVAVAEALLDAGRPEEVLDRLVLGARNATSARRVSYWLVLRAGGDILLTGYRSGETRLPGNGPFLRGVLQEGFGQLLTNDVLAGERRRMESFGALGEITACRVRMPGRHGLLLASDPSGGTFSPVEIGALRLLARLAETALLRLGSSSAAAV